MKRVAGKILLGAIMAGFGFAANGAGPQYCVGTVSNLYVTNTGNVLVRPSYRSDYTQICNLNADTGSVSVATCMTWAAILKTAVQRQSSVLVWYEDAPACNALPVYSATPTPGFVMQND